MAYARGRSDAKAKLTMKQGTERLTLCEAGAHRDEVMSMYIQGYEEADQMVREDDRENQHRKEREQARQEETKRVQILADATRPRPQTGTSQTFHPGLLRFTYQGKSFVSDCKPISNNTLARVKVTALSNSQLLGYWDVNYYDSKGRRIESEDTHKGLTFYNGKRLAEFDAKGPFFPSDQSRVHHCVARFRNSH